MPSRQVSEAWETLLRFLSRYRRPEKLRQDSATLRAAQTGPVSVYSASKAQSSGFFPIRPQLPLVFSHLKRTCFWATHRLAGTPEQAPVHCLPGQVHLQRKPQCMHFLSLRGQEATASPAHTDRVHEAGHLSSARFSRGNGGARRTAGRLLRYRLQIKSNALQPQAQGPPTIWSQSHFLLISHSPCANYTRQRPSDLGASKPTLFSPATSFDLVLTKHWPFNCTPNPTSL